MHSTADAPSTPSVRVGMRFAALADRPPPSLYVEHSTIGVQRHQSSSSNNTSSGAGTVPGDSIVAARLQSRSRDVASPNTSQAASRVFPQVSTGTYTSRSNYAARALHEFMAQCGLTGSTERLSDLLNDAAQTNYVNGSDELPPERASVMADTIAGLIDPSRRPPPVQSRHKTGSPPLPPDSTGCQHTPARRQREATATTRTLRSCNSPPSQPSPAPRSRSAAGCRGSAPRWRKMTRVRSAATQGTTPTTTTSSGGPRRTTAPSQAAAPRKAPTFRRSTSTWRKSQRVTPPRQP